MPTAIRALVFDLADVLLDFGGLESLDALSGGRVGTREFGRFWSQSPWADRLYRGRCEPDEFAAGAVQEFGLGVTPAEFLASFRTWLRGPYPGAFDLLRTLRPHYRLACLSNTNVLDVRRFRDELKLQDEFDHCFFSNEIGLRKPHPDCYRHVVRELNLPAGTVAFFDDNADCITAARACGLQAHQCVGMDALRETLRRLGVATSHPRDGA
jgi:putative hydrolase of the HAD superfamily